MADQAQTEQPNLSRRERPAGSRPRGPRAPRSDAPRNGASSDAPRDFETEPNVLFVAGFPIDCEARTVGELFEKYGAVRHVRLSRGVGRVVFEENDAAQKGLSLNGSDFEGRTLRVELHHKRQRRAPTSRAPREGASPRAEGTFAPREQRQRKPRNAQPASAQPVEQVPEDPTRVFVGKLEPEAEDNAVQAIFSKFGTIANYERARSRRFALIQFSSADEAAKAVASGASLDDAPLRVEIVNPNSSRNARKPREAGASSAPRRPRRAEAAHDAKRLYFGYLPENTQADAITGAYSGVANVELRGKFAYVTFSDDSSAQAAIDNPKKLGESVRIEVAERGTRTRRPRGEASAAAASSAN